MEWNISDRLQRTYTDWFLKESCGRDSVPICNALVFFKGLGLKEEAFRAIWSLCSKMDVDRVGYGRFIATSFIADKHLHGADLPKVLPDAVLQLIETECPVPRTDSIEAEMRELAAVGGIQCDTAQFAIRFQQDSFPPVRIGVMRILSLLALQPANHDELCKRLSADLPLRTMIQFGESAGNSAGIILSALTASNPLWLLQFVNLSVLIASSNRSPPDIASMVLTAIANSFLAIEVVNRICETDPIEGHDRYLNKLTRLLYTDTRSDMLDETIRCFFNIALTHPGHLAIIRESGLMHAVFCSEGMPLQRISGSGCRALCELLSRMFQLEEQQVHLLFSLRIVSCLVTLVNQTVLFNSAVEVSRLLVVVCNDGKAVHELVSQGGLELVELIYRKCLFDAEIAGNCVLVVSRVVQFGACEPHAPGMMAILESACSHGHRKEMILSALSSWSSLLRNGCSNEPVAVHTVASLLREVDGEVPRMSMDLLSLLLEQAECRAQFLDEHRTHFENLMTCLASAARSGDQRTLESGFRCICLLVQDSEKMAFFETRKLGEALFQYSNSGRLLSSKGRGLLLDALSEILRQSSLAYKEGLVKLGVLGWIAGNLAHSKCACSAICSLSMHRSTVRFAIPYVKEVVVELHQTRPEEDEKCSALLRAVHAFAREKPPPVGLAECMRSLFSLLDRPGMAQLCLSTIKHLLLSGDPDWLSEVIVPTRLHILSQALSQSEDALAVLLMVCFRNKAHREFLFNVIGVGDSLPGYVSQVPVGVERLAMACVLTECNRMKYKLLRQGIFVADLIHTVRSGSLPTGNVHMYLAVHFLAHTWRELVEYPIGILAEDRTFLRDAWPRKIYMRYCLGEIADLTPRSIQAKLFQLQMFVVRQSIQSRVDMTTPFAASLDVLQTRTLKLWHAGADNVKRRGPSVIFSSLLEVLVEMGKENPAFLWKLPPASKMLELANVLTHPQNCLLGELLKLLSA